MVGRSQKGIVDRWRKCFPACHPSSRPIAPKVNWSIVSHKRRGPGVQWSPVTVDEGEHVRGSVSTNWRGVESGVEPLDHRRWCSIYSFSGSAFARADTGIGVEFGPPGSETGRDLGSSSGTTRQLRLLGPDGTTSGLTGTGSRKGRAVRDRDTHRTTVGESQGLSSSRGVV